MIHYLRAKYHANLPITPENQWDDQYIAISKDQIYIVQIRQKMFGRIQVQPMRNDDPTRPLVGAMITYPSLFMFFQDWEPKNVSLDPTKFTFNDRLIGGYHGTK